MQENNNFETIISKWRRISVVQQQEARKEQVALASMSGDSSNHDTLLKSKDDESLALVPEHSRDGKWAGPVAVTSGLPAAVGGSPGGKGDLSDHDKDNQEETSDTDNDSIESEPPSGKDRDREVKSEKENLEDKVDSVYLRPPPPHKRAASASPPQEEDCGIKCLYYTLQCCDCVLM